MKVKLKTTLANPQFSGEAGQIVNLPEEDALRLIDLGLAERDPERRLSGKGSPLESPLSTQDVTAIIRKEAEGIFQRLEKFHQEVRSLVTQEIEAAMPDIIEKLKASFEEADCFDISEHLAKEVQDELSRAFPELSRLIKQDILNDISKGGAVAQAEQAEPPTMPQQEPEEPPAVGKDKERTKK